VIEIHVQAPRHGELAKLLPLLSPEASRRVMEAVGYRIKLVAQANARAKGGRRFWAGIASSISYQTMSDGVTVGASHVAAAQKHFGGTISAPGRGPLAKGAKFLTIPISPIAQGFSVGELADKYRIFRLGRRGPAQDGDILATVKKVSGGTAAWRKEAKKTGFLQAAGRSRSGKQQYGVLVPLYVLKTEVTQSPDPWWPTDAQVFQSIDEALNGFMG
jgi:hypothetical protein